MTLTICQKAVRVRLRAFGFRDVWRVSVCKGSQYNFLDSSLRRYRQQNRFELDLNSLRDLGEAGNLASSSDFEIPPAGDQS